MTTLRKAITSFWLKYKADLFKVIETKEHYKRLQSELTARTWRRSTWMGNIWKNKADNDNTWKWLQNGDLMKATEGFILAAQQQAPGTNSMKDKIQKTGDDSKCRHCKTQDGTVDCMVSACNAQCSNWLYWTLGWAEGWHTHFVNK